MEQNRFSLSVDIAAQLRYGFVGVTLTFVIRVTGKRHKSQKWPRINYLNVLERKQIAL